MCVSIEEKYALNQLLVLIDLRFNFKQIFFFEFADVFHIAVTVAGMQIITAPIVSA